MKNLILAGALSLVAHSAIAATNVANVTQLGSVLGFPYVAYSSNTDTAIRITNARAASVQVTCFILDRNGTRDSFSFPLASRASVSFLLGSYYPVADGQGMMFCWATNDATDHQINWNFLTGTAQILRSDGLTQTVSEYSAWSFAARSGSTGNTVGTAGVINLNGLEYDYCAQYVLGQYSPSTTTATNAKGNTTFTGARFAVVPCSIDFVNPTIPSPGGPYLTSVTLTILNEYGVASGSPVACIGSWHEAALPNKPSYATTNTVAFRAESKGGAYGCSGLLPQGVVGTIVETASVKPEGGAAIPDRAASSLTSCGFRAGKITWR